MKVRLSKAIESAIHKSRTRAQQRHRVFHNIEPRRRKEEKGDSSLSRGNACGFSIHIVAVPPARPSIMYALTTATRPLIPEAHRKLQSESGKS